MPSHNGLELLRFYRNEIRFQSDLLSNRLNAFISSQSFLVLAYGTLMSGLLGHWREPLTLLLPPPLALLGLVLSLGLARDQGRLRGA